jgi:hypothetical protein
VRVHERTAVGGAALDELLEVHGGFHKL